MVCAVKEWRELKQKCDEAYKKVDVCRDALKGRFDKHLFSSESCRACIKVAVDITETKDKNWFVVNSDVSFCPKFVPENYDAKCTNNECMFQQRNHAYFDALKKYNNLIKQKNTFWRDKLRVRKK